MKRKILSLDPFLTFLVFLLSILGLLTFFSASYFFSLKNFNDPYFYFQKFFIKVTLLGILFFLIGNFLGQKLLSYKKFFVLIFVLIYIAVWIGFLQKIFFHKETGRFVDLGFINFQPSEIIKPFALLILIFIFLALRKQKLSKIILIFTLFLLLLIFPIYPQPAFSNSMIILGSLIVTFFFLVSSLPQKYRDKKEILTSILVIFILVLGLILFSTKWEYRKERMLSFFTKGQLYEEKYFHVEQSVLGVSSGGVFGKGLGRSEIKILGLPQMLTDSIFVIYAEETGFVGSIFLLVLYFLLILRIILLGVKSGEIEKTAFSLGVSTWLLLQIFVHIGSNIALIVPTGVVLPFFSYGASAQLAIYFSLGIISSFKNA